MKTAMEAGKTCFRYKPEYHVDDVSVIREIADKNQRIFATVVQQYQNMVYGVCYRIMGNQQDAEDAAQDVFVRLFEKAHTFRGQSKITTWLYRIAVNTSLNHLRKKKWERVFSFYSTTDENSEDNQNMLFSSKESDKPDKQFEQRQTQKLLRQALKRLPDKQRAAFVLHKFEGLSYQQITEILNTSLSSVESLIHRAKKNLQNYLASSIDMSARSASFENIACRI